MKLFVLGSVATLLITAEAGPVAAIGRAVFGAVTGNHKRGEFDVYRPDRGSLYARDLFVQKPLYIRDIDGALYARHPGAPPPKTASGSPKHPAVNEANQITIPAFVDMINKKQKFPAALEAQIAQTPLDGFTPPANRAPCPAGLASHPCDFSIKKLTSGKIPDEVVAALKNPKNGWVKGGATKGGKAQQRRDAAYHEPSAQSVHFIDPGYDHKYFTRDVYDLAELSARDAEPEAYYDDMGLYERDAYPEAFYEDFELEARDAEADLYLDGEYY